MIEYNKFRLVLANQADNQDIVGDATNTTNNNYGCYLRQIKFNVHYLYDLTPPNSSTANAFTSDDYNIDGALGSFANENGVPVFIKSEILTVITGGPVSGVAGGVSNNTNTYDFTIPAGLLDNTNTDDLTYYFSAEVANNVSENFSVKSDQIKITITKPDQLNKAITFTVLDDQVNENNMIRFDWGYPDDGYRGIVMANTLTGLPKIQKYLFNSENDSLRVWEMIIRLHLLILFLLQTHK